jgi:hypothetical protein
VDKRKWLQLSVYVLCLVGSAALDLGAPNVKAIICAPSPIDHLIKSIELPGSETTVAMTGLAANFDSLDRVYNWGDYPLSTTNQYV